VNTEPPSVAAATWFPDWNYLDVAFNVRKLPELVDNICAVLTEEMPPFDRIAFRGLSGALVAPLVAVKMQRGLIAVRKGEHCHGASVEGVPPNETTRYIILDDFVSSGETVDQIWAAISRRCITENSARSFKRFTDRPSATTVCELVGLFTYKYINDSQYRMNPDRFCDSDHCFTHFPIVPWLTCRKKDTNE
jgi:orotate phosphoribosyltransferase